MIFHGDLPRARSLARPVVEALVYAAAVVFVWALDLVDRAIEEVDL